MPASRLKQKHTTAGLAVIAAVALLAPVAAAQHYQQTNLVSDVPGLAMQTDPALVNSWGLTRGATTPWWIADNGTGKSTLYNGSGAKQALVVAVPPPSGSTPTGVVFNGGSGFAVSNGTVSGSARFIFVTEDGTISGWSPAVDVNNAILKIDNSAIAVYKGVTLATFNGATHLYVANLKSGKVEVYDSTWTPVNVPGGFVDTNLPAGYAPFNVQNIGGHVLVMFALQGEPPDQVNGRGLGFVDEFDSGGNLLLRLQHGPWLNAPWGVVKAPANFGKFSNDILVGNFGSGEIAAFDPTTGEFLGRLHGSKGTLVISGLWSLMLGGGTANNGATDQLFFTAGIDDEQHGLFGTLTAIVKGDQDED